MKKTLKLALIAAIGLLVLLVAGVFWIDSIAKAGVEQGGTYALGVPTHVRGMDVGILAGGVAIDGLQVDNPAGFDAPYFLRMGKSRTAVSLGTLMEDQVVIPELTISRLNLNLEHKFTKSNYGAILDNLNAFTAKLQSGDATQDGKKFVIRKVKVDNVFVQVQLIPVGGKATRLPVSIDRIELTDVGSGQGNGVQLAQLTALMVEAILQAVLERAGNLMPPDMARGLAGGLDALPGLGRKTVSLVDDARKLAADELSGLGITGQEWLQGTGDTAAKEIDKASKELEKGLADLLKPKKDK